MAQNVRETVARLQDAPAAAACFFPSCRARLPRRPAEVA